jgi:hypothetical protein
MAGVVVHCGFVSGMFRFRFPLGRGSPIVLFIESESVIKAEAAVVQRDTLSAADTIQRGAKAASVKGLLRQSV